MTHPTYILSTTQTKAYRLLRKHVHKVLLEYGIATMYWSMLGIILEAKDGIRQVEIANMLQVKAPLITNMSKDLQGRGLIKVVQNQFDARAKLLAMTPEGKRFVKNVELELHFELQKLLRGLTDTDMMTYHKVLTTIIANDAQLEK
jgi:DNA-binding MarR family transcriptional regulator